MWNTVWKYPGKEREGGLMEVSTLHIKPADKMEIFLFYCSQCPGREKRPL